MLADIISVLATTCNTDKQRECLNYRLLGTSVDVGEWGHEYVRHLGGELATELKVGDGQLWGRCGAAVEKLW